MGAFANALMCVCSGGAALIAEPVVKRAINHASPARHSTASNHGGKRTPARPRVAAAQPPCEDLTRTTVAALAPVPAEPANVDMDTAMDMAASVVSVDEQATSGGDSRMETGPWSLNPFPANFSNSPGFFGGGGGTIIVTDPVTNEPVVEPVVEPTPEAGAVPEPQSWSMMIVGFGLVGAALRRQPAIA